MRRREWLLAGLAGLLSGRQGVAALVAADRWEAARAVLQQAVASGQVRSAVWYVATPQFRQTEAFGTGVTADAMFLLGSISKPICCLPLLRLIDQGQLGVEDRVTRYLPEFAGPGRDQVTVRHLLTHVSGLPDQVEENLALRRGQAPLAEFVSHACRAPLQFAPGSKYSYSSMGILLAVEVARRLTGREIPDLVQGEVFDRLGMRRSAQGLGRFRMSDFVSMQTENAAPEAGGGDPAARDWDWNSRYWRSLGAPWGGTHASAGDLGRWLEEFLVPSGAVLSERMLHETERNQNPAGLAPRGYGFGVVRAGSPGCSDATFGHTGSTGTLAWADPRSQAVCVVLTSLPAQGVNPHPRDVVATHVARQVAAAPQ